MERLAPGARIAARGMTIGQAPDLIKRYETSTARLRAQDIKDIGAKQHGPYGEIGARVGKEAIGLVNHLTSAA
ncbi:hypothetical protein ACK1X7_36945 [Streptomyces sp. CY1]|uniref:hypothetical protein n=1 Tax=Streptomyces sp. CY1 TaxID=3388313 RepID=UPI0039A09539